MRSFGSIRGSTATLKLVAWMDLHEMKPVHRSRDVGDAQRGVAEAEPHAKDRLCQRCG